MPTIGWRDAAFTEATGPVRFRNLTVHIGAEHVAKWRSDPDGRFSLTLSSADGRRAELGKFYPSL